MTDSERYLRGWGISLLVHGTLVGTALWLWRQPAQEESRPEPRRWEVSLFNEPRKASDPPSSVDRLPPPPPPAAEPAVTALAPPDPAAAASAAPAFDLPSSALPAAGGTGGAVAIPVTGAINSSFGQPMAGVGTGGGTGSGPRALSAPDFGGTGAGLAPIVRIPPAYPMEARRKKIEGWAKVEFTVLEDGSVAEVTVRSAQPAGVFDQAATAAIAQWKFRPAMESGKPVRKRAAQTLKFELNK
jgi:protein TonB